MTRRKALSQRQLEVLASYLTVGETYFFREKRSLEVLEKDIVPELIQTCKGGAIRIWSAGCATGVAGGWIAGLMIRQPHGRAMST